MHVIVLGSSVVTTFTDLHDRVVTTGAAGSGTRFTADRLIEVANIRPGAIISASQADGATMLADGRVEAMLSLTGMPTPAVIELANTVPVRLIPLDTYAGALEKRYGAFYTPAVLPSSIYPGIDATETLTTPNLLLSRPDLPTKVIEVVTEALFAEREKIARGHPDANRINVRTAIATAPVRLHPGALLYYQSVKP
jgi:TRAP transporter TAXI family solute receptor